jgi:HrpA-like RNA helicase
MDGQNEYDYDTHPVLLCKDDILTALLSAQVVLCFGETGSGKTTQLPQVVAEAPQCAGKKVCVVQSTVFASVHSAQLVSRERKSKLGADVGYKVGFEDKASTKSKIVYITEEILLREYLADRLLSAYSAIIVEDLHERTVNTDICCGILKVLCEQRSDLKLIVTSVPHNAEELQKYFPSPAVVHVPESVHPVDIFHAKTKKLKVAPEKNSYVQGALNVVMKVHQKNEDGHVLVFLPTIADIRVLEEQLTTALQTLPKASRELLVLSCHEGMLAAQYDKLHQIPQAKGTSSESGRPSPRKCVLVAQMKDSCVHVPHVRFVVDSGYERQTLFDAKLGSESEVVVPVSKVRLRVLRFCVLLFRPSLTVQSHKPNTVVCRSKRAAYFGIHVDLVMPFRYDV